MSRQPVCHWSRAKGYSQITRSPEMLRMCWSAHLSCLLFGSHCTKNALLWVPATGSSDFLQEVFQGR